MSDGPSHRSGVPRSPLVTWMLLVLAVGMVFVLQISSLWWYEPIEEAEREPWAELINGDFYCNLSIAGIGSDDSAQSAREFYQLGLPSPSAYRRLGLLKQTVLGESGLTDLERIASSEATAGLDAREVRELTQEAAMWRDVFAASRPGSDSIARLRELISRHGLGALGRLALSEAYRRAGQVENAAAERVRARRMALLFVVKVGIFAACMITMGIIGIVLLIYFSTTHLKLLDSGPRRTIQPPVLLLAFLAFLAANVVFEVLGDAVISLAGLDYMGAAGEALSLAVQDVFLLCAFGCGLAMLMWLTSCTREDYRDIGLKPLSVKQCLKWGIGGFCAALPLLFAAGSITQKLLDSVFRNLHTPDHPLQPVIYGGSGSAFAVVFVMAVITAPPVEETFFRGALYNSFRGVAGVWPAALLSAAIFAVVHPFPTYFLPILVLGVVLALIREKTGSLIPCMVCHAAYNLVVLILAKLIT